MGKIPQPRPGRPDPGAPEWEPRRVRKAREKAERALKLWCDIRHLEVELGIVPDDGVDINVVQMHEIRRYPRRPPRGPSGVSR